jgi:4-diphosphocytidyl-2-C-methyl-D-erythritol kinase
VKRIRVDARCKINLGLEVLALRPDGYHEIDTVFQTVSLADTIELEPLAPDEIRLDVTAGAAPTGPTNLAWRAAAAFAAATGAAGVSIRLEKRIPVAAGLGGGSADAAAVIVGMNALYGLGLPVETLRRIGLEVGSDVPFLIAGGTARGRGRGEKIEELPPLEGVWFILATPAAEVSAREAYAQARIGLTSRMGFIKLACSAIQDRDPRALGRALRNDLEPGVVDLCPEVGCLEASLRERGAIGAVMSGSGPTVVGVVRLRDDAERIAVSLEGAGRRIHVVEPVDAGCVIRGA